MTPDHPPREPIRLEDGQARLRAADPARSVLLQAPAGSGKTTVLVCRYLALLATANAPEEILAITFTRKAAAEMRERVLRALRAARDDSPTEALIERPAARAALANAGVRGWELLATPARLRIQTIDAFNHGIVARLPVSAGCGAEPEVRPDATALYARAATRTLERALQEADLAPALALLLDRADNDYPRLRSLLASMLATRAHWLPRMLGAVSPDLAERVRVGLAATLRRELGAASGALPAGLRADADALLAQAAERLERPGGDAGAVRAWREPGATLGAAPADLPRWRLLAAVALTGKGSWRRALNVRDGFPPRPADAKARMLAWIEAAAQAPGLHAALLAVQRLPDAELSAEDAEALRALSLLLQQACAELQLVFAADGVADYAQMAGAARAALSTGGAPTDLALRLGAGVRHILVDEFQDTSAEQISLLRALTASWEAGDGRTLFAVGDPMQSIYQFREADVALYLRSREHGIGEQRFEALELHRNFRSAPGIVAWVNRVFAQLFPERDVPALAGVSYLAALAARTEPAGQVQVHGFCGAAPEAEGERVVQIVRTARGRNPACSIAVLVASRRHARPIVRALHAAGIDVRGVQLEPLDERPVARDLLALARALQHPGDRLAWLALLRAPWCGLRLAELTVLAGDSASPLWPLPGAGDAALDADAQARLARLAEALRPAVDGPERGLPLAERVARCWRRLGGPAIHAQARDRDDTAALLDALASDPAVEFAAGEALVEVAAETWASAAPRAGAVEVLTMHAAKGLEWDVVIVPGLGRRARRDEEPLLHWVEFPSAQEEPELLFAPLRAAGEVLPGSLAAYIRDVRARRQRHERVRLLYVTATRARSELHWLGSALPVEGEETCRPGGGSPLAILWPAVRSEFMAGLEPAPPGGIVAGAPVTGAAAAPPLLRVPAQWRPQCAAAPTAVRLPVSLAQPDAAPEYSWVGLAARAIGTVVHAELQRFSREGGGTILAPEAYRAWLAEFGIGAVERAAGAQRVRAALERTLADARGRWILDPLHREAASELRLSGLEGGRIVSVVFDRSFVDAGERWIIDYKTSAHEGGGVEAFLASEVQRYRAQLARYVGLARHLGPEPVRAALYFPLLGSFCEVEPGFLEAAGE